MRKERTNWSVTYLLYLGLYKEPLWALYVLRNPTKINLFSKRKVKVLKPNDLPFDTVTNWVIIVTTTWINQRPGHSLSQKSYLWPDLPDSLLTHWNVQITTLWLTEWLTLLLSHTVYHWLNYWTTYSLIESCSLPLTDLLNNLLVNWVIQLTTDWLSERLTKN